MISASHELLDVLGAVDERQELDREVDVGALGVDHVAGLDADDAALVARRALRHRRQVDEVELQVGRLVDRPAHQPRADGMHRRLALEEQLRALVVGDRVGALVDARRARAAARCSRTPAPTRAWRTCPRRSGPRRRLLAHDARDHVAEPVAGRPQVLVAGRDGRHVRGDERIACREQLLPRGGRRDAVLRRAAARCTRARW